MRIRIMVSEVIVWASEGQGAEKIHGERRDIPV